MGACGGKKSQQAASKASISNSPRKPGQVVAPCSKAEATLQVLLIRADTLEAVGGIRVQAAGPSQLEENSAKDTGKADFGTVKPGAYQIRVLLGGEELKRFKQPQALSRSVSEGSAETVELKLEPVFPLRLILLDCKDKPIKGRKWKSTAPSQQAGTTAGDGLIEVLLGQGDKSAVLEVNLRDERQAPKAPAPGARPPPSYPPAIVATDFKDQDPKPVLPPKEENDWKWTLAVMDPETVDMDSDDALKARLHNLGFAVDKGGGAEPTRLAVRAYQRHYEKKADGSGALADIQGDLKARHDKP